MYLAIVIIITICCVLLILLVLAQNPKGGGLSSEFGGGGSSQMMGVKRTTDLLEKLTWGFAIAILTLSLGANLAIPRDNTIEDGVPTSKNIEKAKDAPSPQQQAPAATQQLPAEGSEGGSLAAPVEEEK